MIKNKNFYVKEISKEEGADIIKKYHYSHKNIGYSSLYVGVFSNETNELKGCLSFGKCLNADATPPKILKGSNRHNMFELNRMVMSDDSPKLSESQAIGLSIKYIKKYYPHILYILSFSDGKEDNFGIIYQATNWKYIGYLKSTSFYKLDGKYVHRTTVYSKYKRNKPEEKRTEIQILKDTYEDVRVIYCKQFIYVFPLKDGLEFELEEKSYPKKGLESGIIKEVIYKESGVICEPKKEIYPEVEGAGA